MSNRYPLIQANWPRLIAPVRDLLNTWGGLWIIENVIGAIGELRDPVILSGGQFGLRVHRPRAFESNAPLQAPSPSPPPAGSLGVYGARADGRTLNIRADGTAQRAPRNLAEGSAAMGIDWMTWRGLCESIPPAYTEHLGAQLIKQLQAVA